MMKRYRILLVGVLLISLLAATSNPAHCAVSFTINKGCGSTYFVGEAMFVYYKVTGYSGDIITVTLKDQLADGTVNIIFANRTILPNVQYVATGVVAPPYGTETLTLEWKHQVSDMVMQGVETCSFIVSSGGGVPTGTSLRIESNVTGFQVWFDGVYNQTTAYNYAILYNVPTGTHTITLKKSGCTDASKTITILPLVTNVVTITMTCTGGGGTETPDIDGDGVPDDKDGCYNPDCNIVDAKGCPKDSDRDGLNECEDECPTQAGSPADKGCPPKDGDNDGVTDDKDSCYNPGCTLVDSQGCPKDSDGDTVSDCEDDCPSEAGDRKDKGCPPKDGDNDGVTDDKDSCYNPGCTLVDSRGCPWDSDGDGLTDCEDRCPNQAGPRANNGCPEPGPTFCAGTCLIAVLVLLGGAVKAK